MTAAAGAKLQMKLSLAADETPDLFHALSAVKDAKRRTGRLKDLAAKGLLLERSGSLALASAPPAPISGPQAEHAAGHDDALTRHLPPGVTGGSLVAAWEQPEGDADARKA
ncbi:hypothetical protein [Roseateles aquatilis]|jgi:hypothetical protein|uniref:hypothetical protein n=1 Tax=Roseateles aquatilis TaxID=431061 RepID=UPI0011305606|nr:hypothetical protein [Roseateles aquatilis]MBY0366043.1 hypothetical protein [Burkholderiaceae bacterium]